MEWLSPSSLHLVDLQLLAMPEMLLGSRQGTTVDVCGAKKALDTEIRADGSST